jgi:hypothetical protein
VRDHVAVHVIALQHALGGVHDDVLLEYVRLEGRSREAGGGGERGRR